MAKKSTQLYLSGKSCQENNAVENSQTLNNRDIANTFFLVFFLASYT